DRRACRNELVRRRSLDSYLRFWVETEVFRGIDYRHIKPHIRIFSLWGFLFLFFFIAGGIVVAGALGSSRAVTQRAKESPRRTFNDKIAPWVIEHTTQGQQAESFVVLNDQADLSRAAALPTKA